MNRYEMNSPIFGKCNLVPHWPEEQPSEVALGYVELEGRAGKFLLAINSNGEWRDRRSKPFDKPIVRWFSVEKPDGSPLI